MPDIPNFDALSRDELMDLWFQYSRASRATCEKIIGDRRPGYTTLVKSDLAGYVSNLATAKRLRESGNIEGALVYENIADRIYNELPNDLRW